MTAKEMTTAETLEAFWKCVQLKAHDWDGDVCRRCEAKKGAPTVGDLMARDKQLKLEKRKQ